MPARLAVDPRNRPFTPQYPLWSDGAVKRRWVRLPDGATIDTRDVNHWDFPVGTRFWKEFAFGGRRVETRMLVKTGADRWEFASYAWNEDQRDAVLAPAEGLASVAEVAPGKFHSVPSRDECRACHDSGRTEILGFTALQLSTDRDPLAPHAETLTPDMVTLRSLVDERRLQPARGDLVATPPRIAARDPQGARRARLPVDQLRQLPQPEELDRLARPVPRSTRPTGRQLRARRHCHDGEPAGPLGGAHGTGRRLAHRVARTAGVERAAGPGEVTPAVEPDAADRHGGRRSRGAGDGERLDCVGARSRKPGLRNPAARPPADRRRSAGERPERAGEAGGLQQRLRLGQRARPPVGCEPAAIPAAAEGRQLRHREDRALSAARCAPTRSRCPLPTGRAGSSIR